MKSAVETHSSAWLVDLLQCPRCGRVGFAVVESGGIECPGCLYRTSLRGRVADFSGEALNDEVGVRTRASFGYEWTEFSDWRPSGEENFRDYFVGVDLATLAGATALDAGCGMGRHARFVAAYVKRLVAVDFSAAIEQAAANLQEMPNVALIRADLQKLPLADASFDFIYSLGVLHHIDDTAGAIRGLVQKLKPGGQMRIYLYWKRSGWTGVMLQAVTLARTITTRLPFGLLKALCRVLSVVLSGAVIWPYRLLTKLGVRRHQAWPLFVYTKYPFQVLYNDQFDRFSAPLEKRYSADEARRVLEEAGLIGVTVVPRFGWIAHGRKPA